MNNRRIEGLGMLSPVWGPFSGPLDASENLRKFTDIAAGPGLGIVWVSCGKLYAIRKPFYDASGAGEIIAYEFGALPPPPTPPTSSGTGVRGWFSWLAGEISKGKAAVGREVGVVEGGLARVWRNNFGMTPHQSDGVGVALDVVGVGLSFALMSFGPLELLGAVALVGGVALLVADGLAYGTEMAGYDETAKSIRYYTFWPRCLATVMTLPDAIWGVGKVLLESGEMAAKAASSLSTADRAAGDVARVTDAGRVASDPVAAARQASLAKRYAAIGEAARRRAQARQVRLAAYLGAQGGSRALIPPGVVFLTKEAVDDPENRPVIQSILARYTFHVSAVHRQ